MKIGKTLALIVGVVVCASVLLLSLTTLKQHSPPPAQSSRLSDGTVVALEAVTYGKQHRFERGGFFGSDTFTLNHYTDSLVFWISLRGPNQQWMTRDVAFDEHGRFISQGDSRGNFLGGGGTSSVWFGLTIKDDATIKPVVLDAFPRRGQTVILRLYNHEDENEPVVEFTTPNPAPGPHSTWTPEPLPITKRDGDLAFTLTGLTTGLKLHIPAGPASPDQLSYTLARFRITENGKPTTDWEPAQIVVSDATGNRIANEIDRPSKFDGKTGDTKISFRKGLCADEPAWKLQVEFSRTASARFASEETWTVKDVPIPGKDTLINLAATAVLQGSEVRLLGIGGPGAVEWINDRHRTVMSNRMSGLEVRARVSLPSDGLRLSLRAVDDKGREILVTTTGYTDQIKENEREYSFNLWDVADDAKNLSLTLALHESRYIEFLAKPSRPH